MAVLHHVQVTAKNVVQVAVTAGALRPSHADEVEPLLLHQRLLHQGLHPDLFGHAGRQLGDVLGEVLPDAAHVLLRLHPEHQVEVGVGVRVDRQHRLGEGPHQVRDGQPRQGGLPSPPFAGESHHEAHL